MAGSTYGLDKIAGVQGYLVVNPDGAVLASSGDLENDEKTAGVIVDMLQTASMIPLSGDSSHSLKRLSVHFGNFVLMATVTNQRIFIVKRPTTETE
ncbi:predicted protein [Nematostella vectensis]|uniref:Ragulator complex protein LAMTOR4 homolog n=1 Tax=Nematostella vectensis TaxID=45351 RepID=LTOR4_NEMVE|nr:ragulator complex protein LAMTOR4 homolog [Nematostella vectensis]A7S6M8.1 RecName: Full=Ragulator complex protein LAMTOR4 homolog; AltName: Full=Late endosomal/lysosomal adaptor and MAPK and MTOR activator 4 [Nematostella vectensis]EDO40683.1 predicted protein [Nematostella vectensis]|eukprot:XP_001632746.1 predicted protein [Nematostella vectensis]